MNISSPKQYLQHSLIAAGCIAVLAGLLYACTIHYDYTLMDDHQLIANNLSILRDFRNIGRVFRDDVFFSPQDAYYRPLLALSFMLDAQWNTNSLWPFHVTNILIHIICSLLVYHLLRRWGVLHFPALLLALAFLLHPALTQAVAWVPGRNDSLAAFFILVSWLFFMRYTRTGGIGAGIGHMLAFFAALLTKETMILLPLLCIGYWWLLHRPQRFRRTAAMTALGWAAVLFAYGVLRLQAMTAAIEVDGKYMVRSFFISLPALLQYIGKIFFPFNLSVLPTIEDTSYIWGILACLMLLVALYRQRQQIEWPWVFFSMLWFLLFLLPSFLRPHEAIMINFLEHRLYLPIIGWLLMVAHLPLIKSSRLLVVLLLIYAMLSRMHIEAFTDKKTFWENAATTSPSAHLAQFNLGVVYYQMGDKGKSAEQFRKALALKKDDIASWVNLGILAREQGALPEAEGYVRAAVRLDSTYGFAHGELGKILAEMGRQQEARQALYTAIRCGYGVKETYDVLLKVSLAQSDTVEARRLALQMQAMGFEIPSAYQALLHHPPGR